MRIAVLTYHANNILGNDYAGNDHIALAEDLRLIHRLGLPIVRLRDAVAAMHGGQRLAVDRAVALTCDDGSWFDWYDLPHPTCGPQPGFRTLLNEFNRVTGAAAHLTSFVIVSPAARAELDRTCLIGRGWWGDEWWSQASAGDLIAIENHSWDHNHDTLAQTAQRNNERGTFRNIETWTEADAEIRQASAWLDDHCRQQRATRLFAYPYGETNEYLVQEYFPRHWEEHRLAAAFTTEPEPLTQGTNNWRLGRYVCGRHWRAPEQLQQVLRDALAGC